MAIEPASAFQAAISGIRIGSDALRSSAQTIAHGTTQGMRPDQLTRALVSGQQAVRQVETAAKVIRTADETLGTLLDTCA
jgi:hypothetical protein